MALHRAHWRRWLEAAAQFGRTRHFGRQLQAPAAPNAPDRRRKPNWLGVIFIGSLFNFQNEPQRACRNALCSPALHCLHYLGRIKIHQPRQKSLTHTHTTGDPIREKNLRSGDSSCAVKYLKRGVPYFLRCEDKVITVCANRA